MEQSDQVQFEIAEVLSYENTYKYIDPASPNSTTNNLFAIKVRGCSSYFNKKPIVAKPANINMKRIPLVGEYVLLVKTFNQESTSLKWRYCWYYISTIDIQSSINDNSIPGLSIQLTQEQIDSTLPGATFQPKIISPLQPFEGDSLIEGRWGNSIRFGSTVDLSDSYSIDRPWEGKQSGDPITIISNGQKNYPNKQFAVENIESDDASLYLTSTQSIPKLLLGNSNTRTPISCYLPNESQFAKSQFIGVADRIILKAKTDIAVIDSPLAIILNTPGEIKLGNDLASESMVHGDVLLTILQKIISQLQSGIQVGDTYAAEGGYTNNASYAKDAQSLLTELLSSKYFMQKNTY
jgi:hypothetical protein